MILTLILAGAAGFATRIVEPTLTDLISGFAGDKLLEDPADRRVAAFLVCLAAAALLLVIGTDNASVFVLMIGAAIGYFQEPIREAVMAFVNSKKADKEEDKEEA